ncbi:unnamed protein product, partial [Symbiodinium necroappetens]
FVPTKACPGNLSGTCQSFASDCWALGPPLEHCFCQEGFAPEATAYFERDIMGVFYYQCCPSTGTAAVGCEPPTRHLQQVQVMLIAGVVLFCAGTIGILITLAPRAQRKPLSLDPGDERWCRNASRSPDAQVVRDSGRSAPVPPTYHACSGPGRDTPTRKGHVRQF